MKIEDLINTYDGIIKDVDGYLTDAQISGPLPIPMMLGEIDHLISWDEQYNAPAPPDDMTETTGLELGKLFSFFQNWANYVQAETTRAKCSQIVLDRHVAVVKSALKLLYRRSGVPQGDVVDHINIDDRYANIDAARLRIKLTYLSSNSCYEQLKRTLNNISREQTRRGEELKRLIHDEGGGRGPEESERAREAPFRRR
jgi:hypothetical protein